MVFAPLFQLFLSFLLSHFISLSLISPMRSTAPQTFINLLTKLSYVFFLCYFFFLCSLQMQFACGSSSCRLCPFTYIIIFVYIVQAITRFSGFKTSLQFVCVCVWCVSRFFKVNFVSFFFPTLLDMARS